MKYGNHMYAFISLYIFNTVPGNNMLKNILLWVVIATVLMSVFNNFGARKAPEHSIEYSRFVSNVKQGLVQQVEIEGRTIRGITIGGEKFTSYSPGDPGLVGDLLANDVVIQANPPEQQSLLMQIFISWFPMLLFLGIWIFILRQQMGGGKGGAFSFEFTENDNPFA